MHILVRTRDFLRKRAVLGLSVLFAVGFLLPIGLAQGKILDNAAGDSSSFNSSIQFERLTIDEGLSNNTVLAALQDSEGFMWFGTADGLNRYDGRKITVFRHDDANPTSISGNSIYSMLETGDGALWIGTDPAGLNRYDRATNSFASFQNDPDDPQSLSNNGVWSLYEDKQGDLWVGTRNGLNLFNPETGNFKVFLPNPDDPHAIVGSLVYCILEDSRGKIWVGTREGLNSYDRETGRFTVYLHDPENPSSISSNRVWSLLEDKGGVLWIGTRGGGLNRLDPATGKFTSFQHDPSNPKSISDNNVWKIFKDRSGNFWVPTERGGLNLFNPSTGFFTAYKNNPNDPASLSHNDVYTLAEDKSGVVWIASRRVGMNMISPTRQRFILFAHILENPTPLNNSFVGPVLEGRQGKLWVGTVGGGLNMLDRTKKTVKYYLPDPGDANSLPGLDIYTLMEDKNGDLWIGMQGAGLSRFEPDSETFANFKSDPEKPDSLGSNYLPALLETGDGRIWVGTLGFGLDLFDPVSGKALHFRNDPDNPNTLSEDTIYGLVKREDGLIWIATGRGGADLFDPQKLTFRHHRHQMEDANSLIDDTVQVIHIGVDGSTWFGTSGGLSRLLPDMMTFQNYNEKNGLPNNSIYGILSDESGGLWLSSGAGIHRLDIETGIIQNFDVSDGLQSIQFNLFSYHRGKSGEMFFGGPKGLNAFFPEQILSNSYKPSVIFTGFSLFNRVIQPGGEILPRPINQMDKLNLSYSQSVFSIEFSADNYQAPAKNKFQYKMEGFDKEWSPPSSQSFATYTNLDPGDYVFKVRAANNDEVWNEAEKSIHISISPPWWQSIWFRLGFLLITTAILFSLIQIRIRSVRRTNQELEERVRDRTHELSQANLHLKKEASLRTEAERRLLEANAMLQERLAEITILRDNLKEQATHDPLTDLFNRRFLEEELPIELARARRNQVDLTVAMIDIDHFKDFNDSHGHKMGDNILKSLADLLRSSTREGDIACRYGGEEFVVILSGTSCEKASRWAEKLRAAFQTLPGWPRDIQTTGTISIGLAGYPMHGSDYQELLDNADKALYMAKNRGRNRTEVFDPLDCR
jgi:diguanylate cyclase (GGDEF)-like protein